MRVDGVSEKVQGRLVLMADNLTWDGKTYATGRRREKRGDNR